jgi:hypothetical protein
MRTVLVSSTTANDALEAVGASVAKLLVEDRSGVPVVSLLAAEDVVADAADAANGLVPTIRSDKEVAERVASVDNIGDFAGRLAAVLAIVDLGDGVIGHYGRAAGAQRLLPAPPEAEG